MKIHTALQFSKFAFILVMLAITVKIILSIIYGYIMYNTNYTGAYFYKWRVELIDGVISKSVYKKINKNENPHSELLNEYLEHISGSAGKSSGRWPYYSYGLQDTFVLDKNTWRIFHTREMLHAELKFLKFRSDFICKMHDIKFKAGASEEERKKATKVGSKFFPFPVKTSKLDDFFNATNDKADVKEYKEVRKEFLDLVKASQANPSDYSVTLEKKTCKVSEKLSKSLLSILNKVLPEFKIGEDELNSFFYRISIIRPKPIDLHVLNRFYWYYFFARYDWTEPGDVLRNENYSEYDGQVKELENKLNGKTKSKNDENKLAKYAEKRGMAKQEVVFNYFSECVGNILGTKGAVVDKKSDERSLLERLFGMGVHHQSVLATQ